MRLSVIVPVYNVEAYIGDCLDTLLDQGLGDAEYEILCVNDGSTDGSQAILEEYRRKNRQISVICQANQGLSAARNTGLRAASGAYVYFIDSDDLLERRTLGELYALAAGHYLDMLLFSYQRFADGTAPSLTEQTVDPGRLCLFRDPMEMRRHRGVPSWRTAWNYLVRRSVLEEFGLTFPEGSLFEDEEFNFWLDRCGAACGYLDQKLYHYRQREGSILRTFQSDEGFPPYIQGRVKLAARRQRILKDFRAGNPPRLRLPVTEAELEDRFIDEVQGILNRLLEKGDRTVFQRTLEELTARGLYPYPMRWRRLVRRVPLKRRLISAASFLFPVRVYLQLCMRARAFLPWRQGRREGGT